MKNETKTGVGVVHESIVNRYADRDACDITVIGVRDSKDDVYLMIEAPVAGSPSTSVHITPEVAVKLANLLVRAAVRP